MINLTKDNFSQCLTGNSLVFFHRLKGCPNCDRMLPQFEVFEKDGVIVYEIDADAEKELTGKYAPQGNWSLPLTVYLENGKTMNVKTGVIDILDATKTLQNIDQTELTEIMLSLQVEVAQKRKDLFQLEKSLANVLNEQSRRNNPEIPVEDFVLPNNTATTAPIELCEGCQ